MKIVRKNYGISTMVIEGKISDPKEDAEKLKNELKKINELHKDLNETLDDLHELLRLSHDLRDSLTYSVGYFNQSTVKRAKVSAMKWRQAMARFKEKAAAIDTELLEKNENE